MYEVIGHGVMETRDIMEITWMETGPELEARDVMKINWSTSIEITNNTPYTRTCTHESMCRCACACTHYMETGPELEARDIMEINWSTSIEITNNTPYTRTCTHERMCRCACACTQYAHVCTYKLEFPKTIIKLSKR